jgi:hypothetical protein
MKYKLRPLFFTACLATCASSLWAQSGLHDPMRPVDPAPFSGQVSASDATQPSGENIQMLVIGRQRAFAMINGVLVKPGESVNQWQLVSIDRQGVVMRNASVIQEFSISPSVVKTVRTSNPKNSSSDSVDNKPSRNRP